MLISEGYSPDDIDSSVISKNLYSDIEPDIIIRTSGEKRLSNFLTWQSIYSELFFLDSYWPELKMTELDSVVSSYYERKVRLGK